MKLLPLTLALATSLQTLVSATPVIPDANLWVIEEASGIFSSLSFLVRGGDEDLGKNRTLNDVIKDVSHEDDLVDIKYVDMDPEYPVRKTPVHINAQAYVKDRIEAATANVRVKYGFITLLNRNYDLCEELKTNLNKTCPVDEGVIEVNVDVDVPGFVPPGNFYLEAKAWRNEDEKQIGRITAKVHF
ncbi:hypothetical protein DL89DRAFT_284520 [Linderina pennispora]|uniref:Phosphatidylglycerol/phosphatidylinositol transfer protein n=1 Tax=Linderina pennispora TaxID=61395 RepID=A0A1Y1W7L6_9FUNG|nr:uncharacterized protein DL89DRAFT_284520 [Linderina pennispora]ORX69216.1 hypothetical protein DL89DRAFT_284520 [Linderina pennispora]